MPSPRRVNTARVTLWGMPLGAVAWDEGKALGSFQYENSFIASGLGPAPLKMPLGPAIYSFPELNRATFRGLPGLLADALPDRFGNAVIEQWLRSKRRDPAGFSPIERLCYVGTRAMGALEFHPALAGLRPDVGSLEVDELRDFAARVLAAKDKVSARLRQKDLATLIRIGTSAGGARAKAILAWNPETNEVRSGDGTLAKGFEPWIMKFDGVKDDLVGDPEGFGRLEYVYHLMATDAGIDMSPCRLFEEGPRAHFMTRRFDRAGDGAKIHMQSFCALRHFDFNAAGAYSYEQLMDTALSLKLGAKALDQLARRMIFNLVARNQDDHTRNFAFLMDRSGQWRLAPAFDIIWSHNPVGTWTARHQMTVNGKSSEFSVKDLEAALKPYGIKRFKAVLEEVVGAVAKWPALAKKHGVPRDLVKQVGNSHRMKW